MRYIIKAAHDKRIKEQNKEQSLLSKNCFNDSLSKPVFDYSEKEILILYYLKGKDLEAVSAELNKPVKQVEKKLNNILKKMERIMLDE